MAETAKQVRAAKKSELEARQSAAVDVLFAENREAPNLKLAKDIALISEEVREAIERNTPEHGVLFREAREAAEAEGLTPRDAYQRAFDIYLKPAMEIGDKTLEDPSSTLMQILGRVAKFSVMDDKGGVDLRGRNELKVAIYKLSQLKGVLGGEKKRKSLAQRGRRSAKAAQSEINSLEGKKQNVSEAKTKLDGINIDANLRKIVDEMRSNKIFELERTISEHAYAKQEFEDARVERDQFLTDLTQYPSDLRQLYDDFMNGASQMQIQEFGKNGNILKLLVENLEKNAQSIMTADPLEIKDRMMMVSRVLGSMQKLDKPKFYPNFLSGAAVRVKDMTDKADKFADIKVVLDDCEAKKKDFVKLDNSIHKTIDELQKERENNKNLGPKAFHSLTVFADELDRVDTAEFNALMPEMHTWVEEFRMALADLAGIPGQPQGQVTLADLEKLTPDQIEKFINQHLKPFLFKLNSTFAVVNGNLDRDLTDHQEVLEKSKKIIDATVEVKVPTIDELVEKAFPGVKVSGGKVTIRGFSARFENVRKQLDTSVKYFGDVAKVDDLNSQFKGLKRLEKSIDRKEIERKLNGIIDPKYLSGSYESMLSILDRTANSLTGQFKGSTSADMLDRSIKSGTIADIANNIRAYQQAAKKFHESVKELVGHVSVIAQAGMDLNNGGVSLTSVELADIASKFEDTDFSNPSDILKYFEEFKGFFEDNARVEWLEGELKKVRTEIASNTELTDAQIAKKLLAQVNLAYDPSLSIEDNQEICRQTLVEGDYILRRSDSYEALARETTAKTLDTVHQAGFLDKVIGFQYKIGDKVEQPLKGLKPEDFASWESIDKLFDIKGLDHKSGFVLLAALEFYDAGGSASIQTINLRKKMRDLVADALGVSDRDDSGVRSIVDKACEDQLNAIRPLVKAYFDDVDANGSGRQTNNIRGMKFKMDALREQLSRGEITNDVFRLERQNLLDQASDLGIKEQLGWSESPFLDSFWHDKTTQGVRDWLLGRTKQGEAYLERAAWSTVGWGAKKTFGGALKLGQGLTYLLESPVRASLWFFTKKREPLKLISGRVGNAAKAVLEHKGAEKPPIEFKAASRADRGKRAADDLAKSGDKYLEAGKAKPLEIKSDPFIDLEKYKKDIAKVDQMLSGKPAQDQVQSRAA